MQPNNPHELPEALRRLRADYVPPRAPAGYLDGLADKVATAERPVPRRWWPRLAAVAAVLLLLVAGWMLSQSGEVTPPPPLVETAVPIENELPTIDEEFLLSVVLLEAEELVLPEEYLEEEGDTELIDLVLSL